MVRKEGKYGHLTGRTLRSSSARNRAKQAEVLCIKPLKATTADSESSSSVAYSLGKRNRWRIPQDIKQSGNTIGDYGLDVLDDMADLVLIERRMAQKEGRKGRKGNCTSVFDGSSMQEKKPKKTYAQVRTLLQNFERDCTDESAVSVEVCTLYPKGTWSENEQSNGKAAGRAKKKGASKHRKGKCFNELLHDNFDNVDDDLMSVHEEESCEADKPRRSSLQLGDFLSNGISKADPRREMNAALTAIHKSVTVQEKEFQHDHSIIADPTLAQEYEELQKQAKELEAILENPKEIQALILFSPGRANKFCQKNVAFRRGKKRNKSQRRNDGVYLYEETTSQTSHAKLDIFLNKEVELGRTKLQSDWGTLYTESLSTPRRFTIDISSMVAGSLPQDVAPFALILFELPGDDTQLTVSVRPVLVCDLMKDKIPDNIRQQLQEGFISHYKDCFNDARHETTVADIVYSAVHYFQKQFENHGVDITTSYNRPSSLIVKDIFGWQCISLPVNVAMIEARKDLAKESSERQLAILRSQADDLSGSCSICCAEFKDSVKWTKLLECGHKFCNACWEQYLQSQASDHAELQCPGHQCAVRVDDITIMSLIPKLYQQYLAFKTRMKLEASKEWRRCSDPDCNRFIKLVPTTDYVVVDENGACEAPKHVVCSCGKMFCFSCDEEAHWPAACNQTRLFWLKNSHRIPTFTVKDLFYSVHVKRCPYCRYPIEKNGGCSHMYCTFCHDSFCWLCLKSFRQHSSASCSSNTKREETVYLRKTVLGKSAVQVACTSHFAKSQEAIDKMQKILGIDKKMVADGSLHVFDTLLSQKEAESKVYRLLNRKKQGDFEKEISKGVFHFLIHAYVVLEGVAIKLASEACSRTLQSKFYKLLRVVRRLETYSGLGDRIYAPTTLSRMSGMVKQGVKEIKHLSELLD